MKGLKIMLLAFSLFCAFGMVAWLYWPRAVSVTDGNVTASLDKEEAPKFRRTYKAPLSRGVRWARQ